MNATAKLIHLLLIGIWAGSAQAETFRVATYNADLSRQGPALLLRDILSGKDAQITAVAGVISHISPDILLLNSFDYDQSGAALAAFADLLEQHGAPYPHRFALRPNTGMRTGLDMDGDGQTGAPRDAQGYGRFAGQGGMALLSRYPIDQAAVQDFSALLWQDFPQALLPMVDGRPFPSAAAQAAQRLSTTGHWVVPVNLPDQHLSILAFHATPPVFDGPQDRNGRRNHDEIKLWLAYLDGVLGMKPADTPFVIMGDANLDPLDSDGRKQAIRELLAHRLVQDTTPRSTGAAEATARQAGTNRMHKSDPALDTVDWKDTDGPGNLRVDYVLPSAELDVVNSGVFWPVIDSRDYQLLGKNGSGASRHRLVWVDIELPQ